MLGFSHHSSRSPCWGVPRATEKLLCLRSKLRCSQRTKLATLLNCTYKRSSAPLTTTTGLSTVVASQLRPAVLYVPVLRREYSTRGLFARSVECIAPHSSSLLKYCELLINTWPTTVAVYMHPRKCTGTAALSLYSRAVSAAATSVQRSSRRTTAPSNIKRYRTGDTTRLRTYSKRFEIIHRQ